MTRLCSATRTFRGVQADQRLILTQSFEPIETFKMRMLLQADAPLVAVVTRLTHQKGTHLIKHAAWRTLERGAQFVLLGSAPDPRVQVHSRCLMSAIVTRIACIMGAHTGSFTL